jgi:8-oxo-dGTP pyrophosphatase MutT (NUDIX family)
MPGDPLRAAGGLVQRGGRILVVHRPKYDDWAFPKGKLERGESWEQAAVREVEEETGLACTLGDFAGSTHYAVGEGLKEVRYFLMDSDGEPRAQNEIDEVRWVTDDEARELLSYGYDRELLSSLR